MDQLRPVYLFFMLFFYLLLYRYNGDILFSRFTAVCMGVSFILFGGYVLLLYNRLMETVKNTGLIDVLAPMLIIVFIIAVGVVLLYQHFQKNLIIHKLREETMKSSHQRELLRANIEAQEEERKRIAHDLHDELGAVLSIMRMNMLMLERQSAASASGITDGLQNVRGLTESALAGMRSISHRLMPPQLEAFGLIATIESMASQINNAGGLTIELRAPPALSGTPWALSLGLYRILMELVNNTIKHSGAVQALIEIEERNGSIVCRYSDNGSGILPESAGKGLGLKSIDGRISAMQGTFAIITPPAGGFCATISVPLGEAGSTLQ
jgi:signal transduction histidine kinase